MQQDLIVKSAHTSTRTGQPMISTLQVAELFEKRHDNVLRVVQNAIHGSGYTPDFIHLNIEVNEYVDSVGRRLPMYLLTEKGFGVISSALTGPKADAFRQRVWEAFDEMAAEIKRMQENPKVVYYHQLLDYRFILTCPLLCWKSLLRPTLYRLGETAGLDPVSMDAFRQGLHMADKAITGGRTRTSDYDLFRFWRNRDLKRTGEIDGRTADRVLKLQAEGSAPDRALGGAQR